MKTKHDYIKNMFLNRDQNRWNLSDPDDAATLLMELMELEWRYHHLALLKYRNHKHKEFHTNWGMYWSIKTTMNILFPWYNSREWFPRILRELDADIEKEDTEMLKGHHD